MHLQLSFRVVAKLIIIASNRLEKFTLFTKILPRIKVKKKKFII
jgi:hypothetical protein